MNENYVLAKKIVNERFNKNEIQYPLFFLCVYGLLCKFDKYKNIVEETFFKTTVLIDDRPVVEIMKNNGMNPEEYFGFNLDEETGEENLNDLSQGISMSGNNYVLVNSQYFVNEKDDPLIICSTMNANNSILLMTLIHEFAHLIKGMVNATYLIQEDNYFGYVIRSGLSIYEFRYYPETNTFGEGISYSIFDEAINCLQTTDMCQEILALDGAIPDLDIQTFIKTIDKEEFKSDMSYETSTSLLESLWKNKTFRNLIEENIVDGNIDTIIEEFDKILGEESFNNLDDLLLEINEIEILDENDSQKMEGVFSKVRVISERFNTRSKEIAKVK